MNEYRVIDKETWPRRELFEFYQSFANPCFNISVSLEASALHARAKERGESFFMLSLYAILRAANVVPQMRQRILPDGTILEFTSIAVMTPIMTDREMFNSIWCEYAPTFAEFAKEAAPKAEKARQAPITLIPGRGDDFICASCLPWLHFTSVTQAEHSFGQTVPILSWGKLENGRVPISCKFNHAFVDGLHASRFFGHIGKSFTNPDCL